VIDDLSFRLCYHCSPLLFWLTFSCQLFFEHLASSRYSGQSGIHTFVMDDNMLSCDRLASSSAEAVFCGDACQDSDRVSWRIYARRILSKNEISCPYSSTFQGPSLCQWLRHIQDLCLIGRSCCVSSQRLPHGQYIVFKKPLFSKRLWTPYGSQKRNFFHLAG
jgi:hypothetical protein